MKINEFFKHNFVMIPVIASVIFGTFTGVKYVIDLTNTIDANNQRVETLLGDLEVIDEKYRDKIDLLKDDLNEAETLNAQGIAELKAEVAKLDSALRMGEDLYRVLADQVREQSYDIKDLNR